MPDLPDWAKGKHDSQNNPRCCTTLVSIRVNGTFQKWYEGEIDCGSGVEEGTYVVPKGYGILFWKHYPNDTLGWYTGVRQGLHDDYSYDEPFFQEDRGFINNDLTSVYGLHERSRHNSVDHQIPGTIWESKFPFTLYRSSIHEGEELYRLQVKECKEEILPPDYEEVFSCDILFDLSGEELFDVDIYD